MTLGLGVRCRDGVVIAGDTLWFTIPEGTSWVPNGPEIPETRTKCSWVDERTVFIPAGSFHLTPQSFRTLGGLALDVAADRLFDELLAATIDDSPDGHDFSALLGRVDADESGLVFMENDSQTGRVVRRLELGRVTGSGNMLGWPAAHNLEHLDVLVDDAIPVIYAMAYAYVSDFYRRCGYERLADFQAAGVWPTVGFPLEIVTLRSSGATMERLGEPAWGEQIFAALGLERQPMNPTPLPAGKVPS